MEEVTATGSYQDVVTDEDQPDLSSDTATDLDLEDCLTLAVVEETLRPAPQSSPTGSGDEAPGGTELTGLVETEINLDGSDLEVAVPDGEADEPADADLNADRPDNDSDSTDAEADAIIESAAAFPTISAAISPEVARALVEKAHTTGDLTDDDSSTLRLRRPSGKFRTLSNWLIAGLMLTISIGYVWWLLASGPPLDSRIFRAVSWAAATIIVLTTIVDVSRLALVSMLAMSTSLVRSPIPSRIQQNLQVAVFITFVPRLESLEVLEQTLIAAKKLKSTPGTKATDDDPQPLVDIFVLDEGDPDDPTSVQDLVDRLNAEQAGNTIRRISRLGIKKYNRGAKYAPKTKHGNFNAAYDVVSNDPDLPKYDILVGLDPDHVPLPELTTRLICYFNDPDIAYVSAPQAYGNAVNRTVPKLAESQQFVFHSLIQSAANSYGGPMLVGTNYAIRTAVYDQIGGAQPSITEDLATGLKALTKRNPETGNEWKAVYTPDVLAHGEGPVTWGDYFKQQNRWATGAIRHAIAGPFFLQMMQMWRHPRRVLHYLLLMAFYPVMGLTWVLGAINSGLFAWYGDSGTVVSPEHWILFYTWTIVLQIFCFISARRYNVSPFETTNSWGVFGMFMSVAAAPIYAASMVKSFLTANPKFDVTPKGKNSKKDSLFTFRHNIFWVVVYLVIGYLIFDRDRVAIETLAWPTIAGLLAVAPILIWLASRVVGWTRRTRTRSS
ncbi:MAG: glycosyltransferase family 2 protein [Gordonia sp. (in: high G+C Gram-positive bacteria)]|uniref:glycosyltransferase family 2 protein n=1 Tax=Gordonia sp. (in: high G+C Gram-positive bacteria) TaxID=84139 RepID=UPI003C7272E9